MFLLLAFAMSAMPLSAAHAQTESIVTVASVDQNSNPIFGYYVVLFSSSGSIVGTGFTNATLPTTAGSVYAVQADGYGNCTFSQWSDGIRNNPMSFTAAEGATAFTAEFNCGTSSSLSSGTGGSGQSGATAGESGAGPGTITIYDHRSPQSDWAQCFALVCNLGTGPGASMWVVLYDSSGNVVATGFSNENGLTFSGLNPSTTYYIYPSDCDLCHGSTHDVLFSYWGRGTTGSDTRPLPVIANGTYVDAWYSCTNGCGGV
jgi:hypothetical protein